MIRTSEIESHSQAGLANQQQKKWNHADRGGFPGDPREPVGSQLQVTVAVHILRKQEPMSRVDGFSYLRTIVIIIISIWTADDPDPCVSSLLVEENLLAPQTRKFFDYYSHEICTLIQLKLSGVQSSFCYRKPYSYHQSIITKLESPTCWSSIATWNSQSSLAVRFLRYKSNLGLRAV